MVRVQSNTVYLLSSKIEVYIGFKRSLANNTS